jgi:cell division inhibitor SulA
MTPELRDLLQQFPPPWFVKVADTPWLSRKIVVDASGKPVTGVMSLEAFTALVNDAAAVDAMVEKVIAAENEVNA